MVSSGALSRARSRSKLIPRRMVRQSKRTVISITQHDVTVAFAGLTFDPEVC